MALKDKKEYSNLKIPKDVKTQWDKFKGRLTYEGSLVSMIGYFEMTGVDPKYNQLPPAASIINAVKIETSVLYKRIDDHIKITRSIESNKLDLILHEVEALKNGGRNVIELGPSEEEVTELIRYNRELQQQNNKYKETIDQLQKNRNDNETITTIIDTVKELLFNKALSKDGNQNVILSNDYREKLIEKIREIGHVQ